jgi:CHASE2 domain-containing sensor protein
VIRQGRGTLAGTSRPGTEVTPVDALNTLRAILVAVAFVAALLLAARGEWFPAAVMAAGILAHFGLWGYLWKQRRDRDQLLTTLEGIPLAER